MYTTSAYALYILISVAITVFVSRTLSKNGEIYLVDGFNGNEALAKSVNHMLVVGFYLLNLGFVLLRIQGFGKAANIDDLLIYLSTNVGTVMFILGVMHFLNMFVIHAFRSVQLKKNRAESDAKVWLARNQDTAVNTKL